MTIWEKIFSTYIRNKGLTNHPNIDRNLITKGEKDQNLIKKWGKVIDRQVTEDKSSLNIRKMLNFTHNKRFANAI